MTMTKSEPKFDLYLIAIYFYLKLISTPIRPYHDGQSTSENFIRAKLHNYQIRQIHISFAPRKKLSLAQTKTCWSALYFVAHLIWILCSLMIIPWIGQLAQMKVARQPTQTFPRTLSQSKHNQYLECTHLHAVDLQLPAWVRERRRLGGYCFCLATHSGFAHSASGHTDY